MTYVRKFVRKKAIHSGGYSVDLNLLIATILIMDIYSKCFFYINIIFY